ncbi:MAG: hypothetical protein ABWY57_02295, partial [Mycetocola sp.]
MFSSTAPWAKSLRVVIPVGVLALALTGCSGGGDSGSDAASSDKIAAVIKGLDNPFVQAMEDGIKDADPDATVQA